MLGAEVGIGAGVDKEGGIGSGGDEEGGIGVCMVVFFLCLGAEVVEEGGIGEVGVDEEGTETRDLLVFVFLVFFFLVVLSVVIEAAEESVIALVGVGAGVPDRESLEVAAGKILR